VTSSYDLVELFLLYI